VNHTNDQGIKNSKVDNKRVNNILKLLSTFMTVVNACKFFSTRIYKEVGGHLGSLLSIRTEEHFAYYYGLTLEAHHSDVGKSSNK